MNNILNWISTWFSSNCDGHWEHMNIIKIETLDNPGWSVTIDLNDTEFENLELNIELVENSENDWFTYKVKDAKFTAFGDLSKLEFLLKKFKELVESNSKV